MSMKRIFVLCAGLVMALCVGVLSSCGPNNADPSEEPVEDIEGLWERQGGAGEATAQFEFEGNHFQYRLIAALNPQSTNTTTLYFSGTYIVKDFTVYLTFTNSNSVSWQTLGLATTAHIMTRTKLEYDGAFFIRQ